MSEAMQQAEHSADRIRDELLRTLEELDRRREDVLDVKRQAKEHWPLLAGIGATLVGMVVAKAALSRALAPGVHAYKQHKRRDALARAWEHPERIAPPRHSPILAWAPKLVTAAGAAVAFALTRRLVHRARLKASL